MRMSQRFIGLAFALLSLPITMGGSGNCGLVLDYTETFLVTDPVDTIVLIVTDGNLDATAYDRQAILLKRHTFGFQKQLGSPEYSVEDGVLRFEAICKSEHQCTHDHMFELPLGIGFDITMADAYIDLGYIDSDIKAKFDTGRFKGIRLTSPQVTIEAGTAEIDIDLAAVPEAVTVDLGEGNVILQVPAGSYRCIFAAESGSAASIGITCDDAATAVLDVSVKTGDITVTGVAP